MFNSSPSAAKWQSLLARLHKVPIVLRYGVLLASGVVALKSIEYQLFSFKYSHELYSGLLAVFFLLVGLMVGFVLLAGRRHNQANYSNGVEPLTASERRILKGLISGWTNQQLADRNNVSVNTVKSHLKSLYRKLQVHSRAEAVALAKERSLV